jgi:perosamine synthetase
VHDFADHGSNYRMLDMQAAVGRVQLRKVKQWNQRRADIARALHAGLVDVCGLDLPDVEGRSGSGVISHAWHVFHVFVTDSFPLPKEEFM